MYAYPNIPELTSGDYAIHFVKEDIQNPGYLYACFQFELIHINYQNGTFETLAGMIAIADFSKYMYMYIYF